MTVLPEGLEDLLAEYLLDARERIDRVEQLLLDLASTGAGAEPAVLGRLKAELHTLKGNSGMMGLREVQQQAHAMEDLVSAGQGGRLDTTTLLAALDRIRTELAGLGQPVGAAGDAPRQAERAMEGVRVPFTALDQLMDHIAETVIHRNRLADALAAGRRAAGHGQRATWADVEYEYQSLGRTLDLLQERVTSLRLTPLGSLFTSLRRLVHDEAARTGKAVGLVTEGGETPLDKALLELANEALGHLVRNAIIHGLEAPADRRAAGKNATGCVRVRAQVKGDEVMIAVSDDGAGMDAETVRRAAAAKGFAVAEDEPFAVLFEAGFTTRAAADIGAGRGVGLSAVREAVRGRGGEIRVTSERGAGTTFELRLPLSVSIIRALLLTADGELYALPLTAVVEGRRMSAGDRHEVNRSGVLLWRGQAVSLLDLGAHFGTRPGDRQTGYVVIVEAASATRGLVADAIHGLQEVVVKGLDPIVGRPAGVAGSTILGDGRPILILDPRRLVKEAA